MQEQWNATLWQFFSVVNSWPSHLARTLTFPQSKRLLPKRLPPALALPTTLISPTSLRSLPWPWDMTLLLTWHLLAVHFCFLCTRWMDDSFHSRNSSMPCIIYMLFRIMWSDLVTYRYKHIWHMIYIDGACLQGRVFTVDPSFQAFQKILIPLHLQLCLCQNSTWNTTWNYNIKKLFIAARVTS